MSRIEDGNLLTPIMLPEGEVGNYIKHHACGLCRRKLVARFAPSRLYYVACIEHGNLTETQTVRTSAAERASANEADGMYQLRKRSKRTAEENIKDLGF